MHFFVKPPAMKRWMLSFVWMTVLPLLPAGNAGETGVVIPYRPSGNLIIITIDGFRWQELFTGADAALISDIRYTPDTSTMKLLYWADDAAERRKKLLPFFWNVIAGKGQLYGNRELGSKVNTSNIYHISYPGYHEIFTGHTDISVFSNKKKDNPRENVLEYLNSRAPFKDEVAVFSSWDVFPYILNGKRSGLPINSGYDSREEIGGSPLQQLIGKVENEAVCHKGATRFDLLTFLTAKEYLQANHPRITYIALGEGDEFAHRGRYDLYLEQANKADRMIAELWHWVQTTPGYKDNTTLLITTDHGRGNKPSTWTGHNTFTKGSSQTWLTMIGPGIRSSGEIREAQQLYQRQCAALIAGLVGEQFGETRGLTSR